MITELPSHGRGANTKEKSESRSQSFRHEDDYESRRDAGLPLDPSKLNQLRMSLKEKLEEIKVLDGEILSLVGDKEVDNEIACLLYTSPSPRDATLSRMPSSA